MLVLTRRLGETLMIGNTIQVTVSKIDGDQVSLAIEAPREVAVYRTELYERMQRERAPSACCRKDEPTHE